MRGNARRRTCTFPSRYGTCRSCSLPCCQCLGGCATRSCRFRQSCWLRSQRLVSTEATNDSRTMLAGSGRSARHPARLVARQRIRLACPVYMLAA